MLKRIIYAIGVAMAALLVGLNTTTLILAQQQPKEKLFHHKSFGEWEYRALQSEGTNTKPEVILSIESSLKGKANLAKLLVKQKVLKNKLFQSQTQIPAIIIPAHPLAPHLLADFVERHDVTVKSYNIIAKASNGEIITIFGSPEGGQVFPAQSLQTIVRGIEQNTQTTLDVQGIAAIDVQLSEKSARSLERDPLVLGLDLTSALAIEDLARAKQIDPSTIQVIPSSLYWANLEDN
jgi:hypothetical protein